MAALTTAGWSGRRFRDCRDDLADVAGFSDRASLAFMENRRLSPWAASCGLPRPSQLDLLASVATSFMVPTSCLDLAVISRDVAPISVVVLAISLAVACCCLAVAAISVTEALT
jgi:hypothetical protein